MVVVVVVGIADAWRNEHWDLMVLFVALAALVLVTWPTRVVGRRTVTVRSDLAAWLVDRARRTGDDPPSVVDDAIVRHRRALEPDRTGTHAEGEVPPGERPRRGTVRDVAS